LAEHAGCNSTQSNSLIISCLQRADESTIASIMRYKFLHSESGNYVPNPFLPVLDEFGEKNDIFTKDPLDMIENLEFNDVPLILGTNKDESAMFLKMFLPSNPNEFIKEQWNNKLPDLLFGRYLDIVCWMGD